jgi:hypothetical protein
LVVTNSSTSLASGKYTLIGFLYLAVVLSKSSYDSLNNLPVSSVNILIGRSFLKIASVITWSSCPREEEKTTLPGNKALMISRASTREEAVSSLSI